MFAKVKKRFAIDKMEIKEENLTWKHELAIIFGIILVSVGIVFLIFVMTNYSSDINEMKEICNNGGSANSTFFSCSQPFENCIYQNGRKYCYVETQPLEAQNR